MKKILSLAVLGSLVTFSAFTSMANAAGTAISSFDVKVNLTSACRIKTASTTGVDFGTYTAFGSPSVSAPTATILFECTNGLPATAALDSTSGVVSGLAYTLVLGAVARTGGAVATSSAAAVADVLSYTVTGTMASSQPGQGSGGAAAQARTLTLTY